MILMHSGIGPKDHLKEIGIDCKVNLPGVGENLQDHPIVCYMISFCFVKHAWSQFDSSIGFHILSVERCQFNIGSIFLW